MIEWFRQPVPRLENCAITMGNFDGMHLGHRKVLSSLLQRAEELFLTPVVLSYLEHPGHYIHFKHPVPILTPRADKTELFKQAGIKHVYYLNFNAESAHASAFSFLKEAVISNFHPKLMVFGYDSHFGYQREGDAAFLRSYEAEFGYQTIEVEPVRYGQNIISSTLIRQCLSEGRISEANAMLGRPYRLPGTVTYGKKIGRTIGFPTVNLSLSDNEQLIPANGIYLSSLHLGGRKYFGLTNIGTSPTLKNMNQIEIETHILDFEGEVYDTAISLDLLEYIRNEKVFGSVGELISAISKDIETGRKLVAERGYDK